MKPLRYYQTEAIEALYNYWRTPNSQNGLIVLPTGTGKSLVIAALIKKIHDAWPQTRIMVLSHVKELLQQNHDEIVEHYPSVDIGLYSAGLKQKDFHAKVIVAGIQSIAKKVHNLDPAPEIVIIDEAHLISQNDNTRYKEAIKILQLMRPKLKVVGLTATPYRLDSGWLHTGDGSIFDQIVYEYPIDVAIDDGFLCPVTTRCPSVRLDAEGVKKQGKEYIAGELEAHIINSHKTELAVKDLIEKGSDRGKWLIFASGLKHADIISAELKKYNISNAVIKGDTPSSERTELIETYKGNRLEELRCLISVGVLTTGFNAPAVDLIALMRPTQSCGLYVQCVGRGTRLHKEKKNCLVLDYAGNILRHGPIDSVNPDYTPWSEGDGIAPAKECPNCQSMVHAAKRVCDFCGFEFPPIEIKIRTKASQEAILKKDIEPEVIEVKSTEYDIHKKEGKKDSIKVSYYYGELAYKVCEWIFPEAHWLQGVYQYEAFCRLIGMSYPYPASAQEFIERLVLEHAQFEAIKTVKEGKFDRVIGRVQKVKEYDDAIPF